jgi:hypothetical protein
LCGEERAEDKAKAQVMRLCGYQITWRENREKGRKNKTKKKSKQRVWATAWLDVGEKKKS